MDAFDWFIFGAGIVIGLITMNIVWIIAMAVTA